MKSLILNLSTFKILMMKKNITNSFENINVDDNLQITALMLNKHIIDNFIEPDNEEIK